MPEPCRREAVCSRLRPGGTLPAARRKRIGVRCLGLLLLLGLLGEPQAAADAIEQPLTATPGSAARGRAIVTSRQQGLCLLCHRGPFPEERFQGDIGSDLAGAGSRWTEGQLRARIVDSRRSTPDSVMPPFHRIEGAQRVGPAFAGRPVLDAQQVEDVVAFLRTLK